MRILRFCVKLKGLVFVLEWRGVSSDCGVCFSAFVSFWLMPHFGSSVRDFLSLLVKMRAYKFSLRHLSWNRCNLFMG